MCRLSFAASRSAVARLAALALVVGLLAFLPQGVPPVPSAEATTLPPDLTAHFFDNATYQNRGCSLDSYTVPTGVSEVRITAIGHRGHSGSSNNDEGNHHFGGSRGSGDKVVARFQVASGQVLRMGTVPGGVGGEIADGRGGAGGDGLFVWTGSEPCNPNSILLVAGAGGGGGGGDYSADGGDGGHARSDGQAADDNSASAGSQGYAGTLTAGGGAGAGGHASACSSSPGGPGGVGSFLQGGSGGRGGSCGSTGFGAGGGGGGGGYYGGGGGGGGLRAGGGGGGGGSSYVNPNQSVTESIATFFASTFLDSAPDGASIVIEPTVYFAVITTSSSENPSAVGRAVTLTATVGNYLDASFPRPTGSVSFNTYTRATDIGPITFGPLLGADFIDTDGKATITTSALPSGTSKIIATYSGDFLHPPTSDPTFIQVMGQAPSLLQNVADLNLQYGDNSQFVANFTGLPEPSIKWQVSTNNGATYFDFLNSQSHLQNISGDFALNGNMYRAIATNVFGTATSNGARLTVNRRALTITADNKTKVYGQALPGLTATYETLVNNDTSASLTGTLACNTTATATSAAGQYDITCSGQSSPTNYAITYKTGKLTISRAATTIAITNALALAAPSSVGQSYSVNFAVSVTPPGAGTPTGTVTVSDGLGGSCSASVAQGTCSITPADRGGRVLIATYGGDTNFSDSASVGVEHSVGVAPSSLVITNAAALAATATVHGEDYVVNWSVTSAAPLTGGVQVIEGPGPSGSVFCSADVAVGHCTMTSGTPGTTFFACFFSSDADVSNSCTTASHTVNKARTTTAITSGAGASDPGVTYEIGGKISVSLPGRDVPLGNLFGVVTLNGTESCEPVRGGGVFVCFVNGTTLGDSSFNATYAGNDYFEGSTSTALTHTVNKVATTTSISNVAPSVTGQSFAVQWSVTPNLSGYGALGGNVTVSDGRDGGSCTAAVSIGQCNLKSTHAGSRTLSAVYEGNDTYIGGTGTTSYTVARANTTTTVTNVIALNRVSVSTQPIEVDWQVAVDAPGGGSPAGTGLIEASGLMGGFGTTTCLATIAEAKCSVIADLSGTYSLKAKFQGDSDYNPSTSVGVDHPVFPADTTTTIINVTALAGHSVIGQSYRVEWAVGANAPATYLAAGGLVTVSGDGSCSAIDYVGYCDLASTTAGLKSLTASYAGFMFAGIPIENASISTIVQHQVDKLTPTVSISNGVLLGTHSVVGQSYDVQWALATANGQPTPSGTVTVAGGSGCTAPLGDGHCSLVSTTAGAKTLTATYNGDANYNAVTSSGTGHTVDPAATATTITNGRDLAGASLYGAPITVKWSVSASAPGVGIPTGNVSVSGGTGCTAAVGAGQCDLLPTAVGNLSISASYLSDGNFSGSSSASLGHQILAGNTTTTITNAGDLTATVVTGQLVPVKWRVTGTAPGGATATGNVNVTVTGGTGCSAPVATGQCNVTILTPRGAAAVVATFVGDTNNYGSTSSALILRTAKASTTTVITNAGDLAVASGIGQGFIVKWSTAVTSPGGGTLAGSVTVSAGSNRCTAAISTGQCQIVGTTHGTNSVSATYEGNSEYESSTSAPVNHQVGRMATTTTISNAATLASASPPGTAYVVKWSVLALSGSSSPTGILKLSANGVTVCLVPVGAGQCSVKPLLAGTQTLVAEYLGNQDYLPSSSANVTHPVQARIATTTSITNRPELNTPTQVNTSYTVKWSVTPAQTDGTVTVTAGDGSCSAPVSAGQCALTPTTAGYKAIVASFSGTSVSAPSSSSVALHLAR